MLLYEYRTWCTIFVHQLAMVPTERELGCGMTKSELQTAITSAIAEVEKRCGRQEPKLQGDTRPVIDLAAWDSLLGVEATLVVEEKIGKQFALESIFVTDDEKPKARTIDEIVELLFETLSNEKAA